MPPIPKEYYERKRRRQAAAQSLEEKRAHVRAARQSRSHHCHWPGCDRQVPPAQWGCYAHWMMLPGWLRHKVWRAYRIGQEETLSPSMEYLGVVEEVQSWIRNSLSRKYNV